ncbi:MAG: hypothetical protein HKP48_04910 [Winogradskyella sp.]|uniref:hypothetical protein n=1 Tax=Winogradskyella sp. TaxID=1883156 RepID=UPI0017EA5E64|nr:hypothetical protein [Winogradskyella sp.]MBT8245190.1 hypothetical protein [Winogradskyella sp.]NNK22639.1 hypothetical protein [Winogradskyella sp.]
MKIIKTISLLISCTFNMFSQDDIIAQDVRVEFISIKQISDTDKSKIIETIYKKNDTLVRLKPEINKDDLDYFCNCFKTDSITRIYQILAFTHKRKRHDDNSINQWNSNVVVYFDKFFEKKTIDKFKLFFKPLNKIKNLHVSYTKKIKDANYHILNSKNTIKNYENNDSIYSESFLTSKATYKLVNDNNNKYYSGKLLIDVDSLKDKSLILKKMKQLFFISLGQFQTNYFLGTKSLTSINYIETNRINSFDLMLLKLHYFKIHDFNFTRRKFRILKSKLKKHCS